MMEIQVCMVEILALIYQVRMMTLELDYTKEMLVNMLENLDMVYKMKTLHMIKMLNHLKAMSVYLM